MALSFLRGKRNSIFTTIIFGFIILTFVLWGGFGNMGEDSSTLVSVNGDPISKIEFQRILSRQIETYAQFMGGDQQMNKTMTEYLEAQVAQYLVMRKVLSQKAKEMGIEIGKKDLLEVLEKNTAFHDPALKRFSPKTYEAVLRANNFDPREYEKSLSEDLAGERLRALLEKTVTITPQQIADQYKIEKSVVDLDLASLDSKALQAKGALGLTDKDFEVYFDKNRDQFKSPSARVLELAVLNTSDLPSTTVSEDQIKTFYEKSVKGSDSPKWNKPQVHALHILIADNSKTGLEKVTSIKKSIKSEADFRKAAITHSEDFSNSNQGGDLGYFDQGTMVKPFTEAAFTKAAKAEAYGPVKTDYGYHLVWVLDRTTADRSLENRKLQITNELKQESVMTKISEVKDKLKKLTGTTDDVASKLKDLGFTITETTPVHEKSRSDAVPFTLVFKSKDAKLNEWQSPEEIKAELYFYRVKKVLPPENQNYQEAKTAVETKLVTEKTEALVREWATLLKDKKMDWATLTTKGALIQSKKTVKQYDPQSLEGWAESESVHKAALKLTSQKPTSEPLFIDGKWTLLRASNFANIAPEVPEADKERIKKELLAKKSRQVVDTTIDQLVKSAKIPEEFKKQYRL